MKCPSSCRMPPRMTTALPNSFQDKSTGLAVEIPLVSADNMTSLQPLLVSSRVAAGVAVSQASRLAVPSPRIVPIIVPIIARKTFHQSAKMSKTIDHPIATLDVSSHPMSASLECNEASGIGESLFLPRWPLERSSNDCPGCAFCVAASSFWSALFSFR